MNTAEHRAEARSLEADCDFEGAARAYTAALAAYPKVAGKLAEADRAQLRQLGRDCETAAHRWAGVESLAGRRVALGRAQGGAGPA